MTIDEQIAVLQAYKDEKLVEVLSFDEETNEDKWMLIPLFEGYQFNFRTSVYRIKPEEPKPKYRPYQSAEEVMEGIKEHGPWIRNKYGFLQIVGIDNDGCRFGHTAMGSFDGVFNDFTWPDGTPFGVKEE